MGDSPTMSGVVQPQIDWSNTTPSMAVIDAIAFAENTKSADVSAERDATLFDHVGPDALDTLVTKGASISISFTIDEHEVRFDGDALEITHR